MVLMPNFCNFLAITGPTPCTYCAESDRFICFIVNYFVILSQPAKNLYF